MSEEIFHEVLKIDEELSYSKWPEYDEEKTKSDTVTIAFQVNGKVRGEITVSDDMSEDEVKELAYKLENVKKYTDGKEIIKTIVIHKKIVNIVVKG